MTVFANKKNSIGCRSSRKRLGISFTALLSLVLFAALTLNSNVLEVRAATDSETALAVFKGQSEVAAPFSVHNMFPGDRTANEYNVQVSYTGDLTLHFHSDIRPGYEKLAEVLKCQIRISEKEVYDGLIRDMPAQLDHVLSSSKGITETVSYDIAVYLDTSVGNDYQNKELVCDFRWWVEVPQEPETPGDPEDPGIPADPSKPQSPGELIDPPKTGDTIFTWFLILMVSGSMLILLWAKRKKEESRDAGK